MSEVTKENKSQSYQIKYTCLPFFIQYIFLRPREESQNYIAMIGMIGESFAPPFINALYIKGDKETLETLGKQIDANWAPSKETFAVCLREMESTLIAGQESVHYL